MTDSSRLIERLRVDMENGYHGEIMAEIIDTLEKQAQEIEQLREGIPRYLKKLACEMSINADANWILRHLADDLRSGKWGKV